MPFDRVVGLQVADEASYARYREGMLPTLTKHGGVFRYDLRVSEVLKAEAGQPINRLFVLRFPDQAAQTAFFADPAYLAVREAHFKPAVATVSIIGEYAL
jgi:uncharacterized protein (DUF1330 family)